MGKSCFTKQGSIERVVTGAGHLYFIKIHVASIQHTLPKQSFYTLSRHTQLKQSGCTQWGAKRGNPPPQNFSFVPLPQIAPPPQDGFNLRKQLMALYAISKHDHSIDCYHQWFYTDFVMKL